MLSIFGCLINKVLSQCFVVVKYEKARRLFVREPAEGSILVPAAVWRPGPMRGHGTALQAAEAALLLGCPAWNPPASDRPTFPHLGSSPLLWYLV